MFVDEVDIHVTAGAGGRGCLAFRRELRVPRGGPSGGDGGHGGSIYVVASPHTNTLINYRFHPEFDAERGQHGKGSNRTGHGGADLELAVPIGTLVYEKSAEPGEPPRLLADLAHDGRPRARREGRPRRHGQRAVRDVDQSRAAQGAAGRTRRGKASPPRAEAARGRRARRLSERRQVHADRADLRGSSEDRRLSVHDADAESRRRASQRRSQLRRRRRARA